MHCVCGILFVCTNGDSMLSVHVANCMQGQSGPVLLGI